MQNILLQRELYIAFNAQPLWLRIIKFPVILVTAYFVWKMKGWKGAIVSILIIFALGIMFHLFLRYMTTGWTQPWFFVPKITTPYDVYLK